MKPVSLIVSALAAVVAAAPAPAKNEERSVGGFGGGFGSFDLSGVNNFNFLNSNFGYLAGINSFDLNTLLALGQVNNFDVNAFGGLFNSNVFDIATLLQLQSLQTLLQFSSLGLFNGFDLSSLALQQLNLGLLQNVGVLDLGSFVDSGNLGQIQAIAQQSVTVFVKE
jgi:hypothetical protein